MWRLDHSFEERPARELRLICVCTLTKGQAHLTLRDFMRMEINTWLLSRVMLPHRGLFILVCCVILTMDQ